MVDNDKIKRTNDIINSSQEGNSDQQYFQSA